MTDTIQVTATLLPVGQELVAKPGDRIMVVAGVAVGVYTGEVQKPRAAAMVPPVQPTTPRPQRVVSPSPSRKGISIAKPRSVTERQALRDRIIALLQNTPNLSTTQIADQLGYARDDKDRWHVSEELSVLMKSGRLNGTLIGKDARLGRRYVVSEKNAA